MNLRKQTLPWPTVFYVLAWTLLLYLYIQILSFDTTVQTNWLISGIQFIDFGVHELSHIVVMFLPQLWVALAGSAGEITFTLLILYATIRAKAWYLSLFASMWVMIALHSVGRYIADARAQALPLMGPGESVKHDWNFILGQLGWLEHNTIIGAGLIILANVLGALALVTGIGLIGYKIVRAYIQT